MNKMAEVSSLNLTYNQLKTKLDDKDDYIK